MKSSKYNFIQYFLDSITKVTDNKVGIELEAFLCKANSLEPVSQSQFFPLLDSLPHTRWKKLYEGDKVKGLTSKFGSITFEPGLQIEFSSAPEYNLNILETSYEIFTRDVKKILSKINAKMFAMGHHPFLTPDSVPRLDRERYNFMYNYMPKVGTLGQSMMTCTTSLQINIDYNSISDLTRKVHVLANITPFLLYFSASSPFKAGKVTPYLSYRNHIWENTDKARTGMPDFFFRQQFSLEKYVDYLLNIPVYFFIRDNKYVYNEHNRTFLEFMKSGEIELTMEDFVHHLSTAFPDIRIKQFLEIRPCDPMGLNTPLAIPALIVGLLYNTSNLEELCELTKNWTKDNFLILNHHLNTKGLTEETFNGIHLVSFTAKLLDLAFKGLSHRGFKEERFLHPLQQILATKTNLSQKYLKYYNIDPDIYNVTRYIIDNS